MTKALISVTGQDTTGIIARVATKLSELNINILDITQTILSGCFTMMMVVDLDGAQMEFAAVDEAVPAHPRGNAPEYPPPAHGYFRRDAPHLRQEDLRDD